MYFHVFWTSYLYLKRHSQDLQCPKTWDTLWYCKSFIMARVWHSGRLRRQWPKNIHGKSLSKCSCLDFRFVPLELRLWLSLLGSVSQGRRWPFRGFLTWDWYWRLMLPLQANEHIELFIPMSWSSRRKLSTHSSHALLDKRVKLITNSKKWWFFWGTFTRNSARNC